jgi:hypothetical protein
VRALTVPLPELVDTVFIAPPPLDWQGILEPGEASNLLLGEYLEPAIDRAPEKVRHRKGQCLTKEPFRPHLPADPLGLAL